MSTFVEVTVSRSASITLRFHVEAETAEAAEAIVQRHIDENKISDLGAPVDEYYSDDEESAWEVLDAQVKP